MGQTWHAGVFFNITLFQKRIYKIQRWFFGFTGSTCWGNKKNVSGMAGFQLKSDRIWGIFGYFHLLRHLKVVPAQCAAQRTVMQKWRRPPDTSVWGSRYFHDAETKSKPACLPRHGTREVRYFEHKSPIFLTPPQEQVELHKLKDKKVGVIGHFGNLKKKTLFPFAIHTKTRMLFGQHFDGEAPRNLNHVFLTPFEHGFNKKLGTFMFKNQYDGAKRYNFCITYGKAFYFRQAFRQKKKVWR